ncbi:hypothetical protein [Arthrobacter sp. Soil763]|uniref:hypothetical protein n=1 Tax=Arthrobacter sp. Soil763 TaxID=1736402 RepID=UPI0006F836BF|nr:hypothetical protein [Arthrobacter sp. Soil763]KRE79234.1 hypothetical protein ASG71_03800 [Arthrobacter sp. Soil763]
MYLRRLAPAALLLTIALGLAACGGSAAPTTAGSTPAGSPGAPSASQSPSPTPTPTPTAAAKEFSQTELAAIVAGLKDAQGKRLTAIPAAQLEEGIAASKEMMSGVVITPKACAAVADSNAQIPPGSVFAGGASESTTVRAVTAVTLVAFKDPAVLAKNVESSVANTKKCENFTMEMQGQKLESATEILTVPTSADASFASLSTQTMPDGEKLVTVVVMGASGGLSATAVVSGPDVTKGSAPDMARMVDDALARAGAKG